MNYLTHVFLADNTPESFVGAMLGDFVKGAAKNNYPPIIQCNIELHRNIDSFTDVHPMVRAAKPVFSPERRRLAGILLDIFYDLYLAKHWDSFSEVALPVFTSNVYAALRALQTQLPDKLPHIALYAGRGLA